MRQEKKEARGSHGIRIREELLYEYDEEMETDPDGEPDAAQDEEPKRSPDAAQDRGSEQGPDTAQDTEPDHHPDTDQSIDPEEEETKAQDSDAEADEVWRPARPSKAASAAKKIGLGILFAVLAVLLTFGYSLWSEYSKTESTDGKEISVTIEQGSSTREVAAALKEAGVIRYEIPFLLKMYRSEYRGKLRYGTFTLNDGMCLSDVIETLATKGALMSETIFTIPEGYSVEMIAQKLQEENIMTAEEFLNAVTAAAADSPYAAAFPAADQVSYQLQGYLYPDTYYLSENMTGEELVDKILAEFDEKWNEERQAKAAALGMTVEEVLIRASLVQKETERAEEYPTVAGVINNRLAKDMPLQFDSTVVYAISDGLYGVERVLYDYLTYDSPYNTYTNKGLPAGPICNPSLAAIDGVLNPETHNYLYFQTDAVKNDGSNLYFETYEEHAAAAATTATDAAAGETGSSTENVQGETETSTQAGAAEPTDETEADAAESTAAKN